MSGDTERGASQPVAAQMLHAGGEREGRRVDRGRGGVLQAAPAAGRARAPAAHARRVHLLPPCRPVLLPIRITLHQTIQFTLYFVLRFYTLQNLGRIGDLLLALRLLAGHGDLVLLLFILTIQFTLYFVLLIRDITLHLKL